MIKVKLFDQGEQNDLEFEMNRFLQEKRINFKLIDIKYFPYTYGEDRLDFHAAMIIYEE